MEVLSLAELPAALVLNLASQMAIDALRGLVAPKLAPEPRHSYNAASTQATDLKTAFALICKQAATLSSVCKAWGRAFKAPEAVLFWKPALFALFPQLFEEEKLALRIANERKWSFFRAQLRLFLFPGFDAVFGKNSASCQHWLGFVIKRLDRLVIYGNQGQCKLRWHDKYLASSPLRLALQEVLRLPFFRAIAKSGGVIDWETSMGPHWTSKEEYDESGPSIMPRKCF